MFTLFAFNLQAQLYTNGFTNISGNKVGIGNWSPSASLEVSTQTINGGAPSGTEFIAEIKDCLPDVEIISSKGLDDYISMDNSDIEQNNNTEDNSINSTTNKQQVKAYPTVEVEDKLTLEIEGLNEVEYALVSLDGQVILQDELKNISKNFTEIVTLPNMAAGMYLLMLRSNNYSKTIKLLKR